MVNLRQRNENEKKVVRTLDTFFSNDDTTISASLETHDCNIYGSLTVIGNMKTRNIWLNNLGDLEVYGNVKALGEIKAINVTIWGDLSCYSIHSSGAVLITGNCSCDSITSFGDVIIDGNFSGEIENIKVSEECNIYINGKCVK